METQKGDWGHLEKDLDVQTRMVEEVVKTQGYQLGQLQLLARETMELKRQVILLEKDLLALKEAKKEAKATKEEDSVEKLYQYHESIRSALPDYGFHQTLNGWRCTCKYAGICVTKTAPSREEAQQAAAKLMMQMVKAADLDNDSDED
jgi:hypothetical protein